MHPEVWLGFLLLRSLVGDFMKNVQKVKEVIK
jgi:hypothetical protein